LSGFLSVGYDFYGVALDFYILTSWFSWIGLDVYFDLLISSGWSRFLKIGLDLFSFVSICIDSFGFLGFIHDLSEWS